MTIRSLAMSILKSDSELAAVIPGNRWYTSTAVRETPPRPFAVVRYAGTFPGLSRINQTRMEIWYHDEVGSYSRINELILRTREVFALVVQRKDPDSSSWIMEAKWEGDSVDLYDDAQLTNARSCTFTLTGTGI